MRKLLFLLIFIPFVSFADERIDYCENLSNLAGAMMEHRQYVNDFRQALEIAGDNPIYRRMMVDMYEQPRYETERFRDRQVEIVRDRYMRVCIRELFNN